MSMIRTLATGFCCLLMLTFTCGAQPTADWKSLAPGMDFRWVTVGYGDATVAVVRIDPALWSLDLVGRSRTGDSRSRTAREWARAHGLVVAINAGMYASDLTTHIGYMECGRHVNSSHVNAYQSVAAFDPRDSGNPPFRIFDLDEPGVSMKAIRRDYASVVQNLRLIKRPGTNRWNQRTGRWSEAALGEDTNGRVLLVMSRTPFSMPDLNARLLAARIGIVALQHLEGGPEAQLYLNVGGVEMQLVGSYRTSPRDDDRNASAWPVPNVLGVRRR